MNLNANTVRDGFTRPDDESAPDRYNCPWCDRDHETVEQVMKCAGFKPSGMPPNQTGHPYSCGCQDCRAEYKRL